MSDYTILHGQYASYSKGQELEERIIKLEELVRALIVERLNTQHDGWHARRELELHLSLEGES